MKEIIDQELKEMVLNDRIKENIRNRVVLRPRHRNLTTVVAAALAVVILGGTTVFAGYYLINRISVNEAVLPELDAMYAVQMKELGDEPDENEMINRDFSDYKMIKDELGISLLYTEMSNNNSYMRGHIETDNNDFAIITVENFILGDTSNYQFLVNENRYTYDHGEEYYSPVSLTIDVVLSKQQESTGWDVDYLGMFEFVESFTSTQGYKVNILQDTTDEDTIENYVSEKTAVFVANGIRYTMSGRVPVDTIKSIVESMR